MDLFLIRHGETQANADGIVQGWLDTNLNGNGHRQAQDAAESFNEKIEAIYVSDLQRTKQTAAYFREKYGEIPYFEDERIRERNFGDAAGHPREMFDWDRLWAASDTTPIPNTETLNAYNGRVQAFLDELKQSSYQNVLVVTHSGTINRIRDLALGQEFTPHPNASVTKIHID